MKVILVTASLGDAAGGLASAVREWAEALSQAGIQVTIFCLDITEIFGKNRMPVDSAINVIEVPGLIEKRIRLILAPTLASTLARYCIDYGCDILHTNGVWPSVTRITQRVARRLAIPFVVSPHGHLQPWAMEHRPIKKQLAWMAYGRSSLVNASLIQAASLSEELAVRKLGIKTPTVIIPNVIAIPTSLPVPMRSPINTLLFLSRIHPSKGLMDLVEAWGRLRPVGWRVVVAGPDEIGHLAAIREKVCEYRLEKDFEFVGTVSYETRWEWFFSADLFVLPTYSENFGVTIGEALGSGVPVITTTAAPWPELEKHGCGWWIETGAAALEAALREALSLTSEERRAMGAAGRDFVADHYSANTVGEKLIEAYRGLLPGRS